MDNKAPEANEGYTIIKSAYAGGKRIVLGYNPRAQEPYVTWKAKGKSNDFYHGRYFKSEERAVRDFHKRIKEERPMDR